MSDPSHLGPESDLHQGDQDDVVDHAAILSQLVTERRTLQTEIAKLLRQRRTDERKSQLDIFEGQHLELNREIALLESFLESPDSEVD